MAKRSPAEIRQRTASAYDRPRDLPDLIRQVKTVMVRSYPKTLEGRYQDLDKDELRNVVTHCLNSGQVNLPTGYTIAEAVNKVVLAIVSVPELEPYLNNPDVTDIMIKGERVYIETPKKGKLLAGTVNPELVTKWVRQIAAGENREFNFENPRVNLYWDERRISAVMPPCSNMLSVSIRIHRLREIPLESFVPVGPAHDYLVRAVEQGKNMIIIGPAGAGKSTLLQALARHIPVWEFPYIVEDVREIRLHHEAAVSLQAEKAFGDEGTKATLHDLIQLVLRQNPDRIILQELLGREALELLDAAGTGQAGCMTTIHANSPEQAIDRLVTLMTRAQPEGSETYRKQIYDVINLIIHIDKITGRDGVKRQVQSINELTGGKIKTLFAVDSTEKLVGMGGGVDA
jgi:pilus assembly protein CpaF